MSGLACHTAWMADGFDMAVLRRNLAALMKREGVKPTSLSLRVGKSPTLVKDLLEKTSDTKLSTIFKLAEALHVQAGELLGDGLEPANAGPTLFLKGEVAAGMWIDAFEWPHDDWQAMTGRPDVGIDPLHRFFLRVCGDSMDLVYPHGTYIECASVFGRVEARPGSKVVVLRRRADQRVEATVKEMVEIDGAVWFVPRSSNPVHQSFRADLPGEGIEETRIAAVVISSVRPE
jgi:SOS-response transcriptional repressor LexA